MTTTKETLIHGDCYDNCYDKDENGGWKRKVIQLQARLKEMTEAKERYQKRCGEITKELWDTKARLDEVLKRVDEGEIEKALYEFNSKNQATVFITTTQAKTRYPIQYKRWMKPLAQAIVKYLRGE